MRSLFIGQSYIDVTMIADGMPTGDEKAVARDYAVSFGGNAVTAGFACAKLDGDVDMITSRADDWLGQMFGDMAERYGVHLHTRRVKRSSLSFILPNNGKRAILRARDDDYLEPFPMLDLTGCRALHVDGHLPDAAIHYAKLCRERGVLTSLDGGAVRDNTHELLTYIDVAMVAERFCEQMNLDSAGALDYLKSRGCRIGGVTEGERGVLWYDETGAVQRTPALALPFDLIIDTSGAGDIFHGAYVASYLGAPDAPWREHLEFARAASAFKIQHLGNEAGLPSKGDVARIRKIYGPR
jgi:sugar/nucleoside kinase (ribokinase family)